MNDSNEVIAGDVLYLITKEPKQFEGIVEELLGIFTQRVLANSGSHKKLLAEQIHCKIIVLDLPPIPTFLFTWKTVHLNCALTTFRCIVQSTVESAQYM